jgi:hypothetical protein
MTLQACNLIPRLAAQTLHAAVIRIACSCNCTIRAAKQSGIYVHACSRVDAVRHIPWSLYLAVATQHVAQTLCSQKQHKTRRWQQAGATVQPELQRSGIDVCLFRWVGPIKQMLQAVPGCDGMLHKPCAYGIQNSLQTAAADQLSCKTC